MNSKQKQKKHVFFSRSERPPLCHVICVNSWQKMNVVGEERKDGEAKAGRVIGLGRAGRAIIKWMDVKHRTI